MDAWKPFAVEGVHEDAVVDPHGRLRKEPLQVGRAESLTAMLAEWRFFTPAVLYLSHLFDDRPLIDFWAGHPAVRFHHRLFAGTPIFAGLTAADGDQAWNHVLWAVRKEFWEAFASWMCGVRLVRRDLRIVFGVAEQQLVVVDPLACERSAVLTARTPLLPISAFGVHGSSFGLALRPPADPLSGRPTAMRLPGSERMRRYARAYFAGRNPVNELRPLPEVPRERKTRPTWR